MATWVDRGEKVTSYFCNLEIRFFLSKCMSYLVNKNQAKLCRNNNTLCMRQNCFMKIFTRLKKQKTLTLNKYSEIYHL